ncbi:MAG TPA: antitoxin VapB family protein [Candidatus Thermoplasmatota archaeon]|nr:antitoxin VapB family protein [Candidatus Thermoplasmatota archaeon]
MTRMLQVTERAYETLRSLKRPGESFSELLLRLAGERSLLEAVGVLDEGQAAAMEATVNAARERSRRRRGRQLREPR